MLRLEVAAIYAGINILLLAILAVMVGLARQRHKIVLGDGGNQDFLRAQRAHANAAEYVPAGLVGVVLLALLDPAAPLWLLHASGLSLTIGRILHAFGLHAGVLNIGRVAGTLLTVIAFVLMGVGLLYAGLSQQL